MTSEKATLVPLHYVSWQLELDKPYEIHNSVTVENVKGMLTPTNFDLWREYLSHRDRDGLASMRIALVHRFQSSEHIGMKEKESQDLLYKVFLCLRIVKPTKSDFAAVQFKYDENGNPDVFSFTHPPQIPINVPEADALNSITLRDIEELQRLLGPFLTVAEEGPENVRRAIRFYGTGYSDIRDPIIQIVIWTMGIEAVLSTDDEEVSKKELLARIDSAVGFDSDIFSESEVREYAKGDLFTVGSTVEDLFELRDLFVHGKWIPSKWKSKHGRSSIDGPAAPYADTLREAAAFILRKSILNALKRFGRPENK